MPAPVCWTSMCSRSQKPQKTVPRRLYRRKTPHELGSKCTWCPACLLPLLCSRHSLSTLQYLYLILSHSRLPGSLRWSSERWSTRCIGWRKCATPAWMTCSAYSSTALSPRAASWSLSPDRGFPHSHAETKGESSRFSYTVDYLEGSVGWSARDLFIWVLTLLL